MASLFLFILIADPLKLHEDFAITYQFHSIFQVSEKLHQREKMKRTEKHKFLNLTRRVDEFTLRFLDALDCDVEKRKQFFLNPETNALVETAIKLDQKKVILQNRVICSVISNLSMEIY